MGLFDLYSKRQKSLRGEVADIYIYDELPQKLRVQIVHIITDSFGKEAYAGHDEVKKSYKYIHEILCREYGTFRLGKDYESDEESVLNFFLKTKDIEEAIDIIELCMRYVDLFVRKDPNYNHYVDIKLKADDAINELNQRFKENGIGFCYSSGQIIRIDSTTLHKEITLPTLNLLSDKKFKGANQEYLNAQEHYKQGRNKESLNECLKSFESVMKIICKEKGWTYEEKDTAKKLIQICLDNQLIPSYLQNQFASLRSLFESGISTIRNKVGGHGQGQENIDVEDQLVRYCLNLTGTNIIYLVEQSGL